MQARRLCELFAPCLQRVEPGSASSKMIHRALRCSADDEFQLLCISTMCLHFQMWLAYTCLFFRSEYQHYLSVIHNLCLAAAYAPIRPIAIDNPVAWHVNLSDTSLHSAEMADGIEVLIGVSTYRVQWMLYKMEECLGPPTPRGGDSIYCYFVFFYFLLTSAKLEWLQYFRGLANFQIFACPTFAYAVHIFYLQLFIYIAYNFIYTKG